MKKIKLGYLYRGDIFYFKGEKYKICSVSSNKIVDTVCCRNLDKNKNKWFDVDDEVEIEE